MNGTGSDFSWGKAGTHSFANFEHAFLYACGKTQKSIPNLTEDLETQWRSLERDTGKESLPSYLDRAVKISTARGIDISNEELLERDTAKHIYYRMVQHIYERGFSLNSESPSQNGPP